MNTPTRIMSLAVLLVWPLGFAHAADVPARGPLPFAAYDKDKNGTISEEEFYATRGERMGQRAQEGRPMRGAAGAPTFEQFDTDKNGQLTEAELNAGQQTQMQQRPGQGGGPGAGQGPGRGQPRGAGAKPPTFVEYDLNRDGELTEQEFQQAHEQRIKERAQQGGAMRNLPKAPAFADLDTNKDGKVTSDEFTAHQVQQRGQGAKRQ